MAILPQVDRAFVTISIANTGKDGRFAAARLQFPDGAFIQDATVSHGVGNNFLIDVALFDPTFYAVESSLGLIGNGGDVSVELGWIGSGEVLPQRLTRYRGTLVTFRSQLSPDGASVNVQIAGTPVVGNLPPSELARADGVVESFYADDTRVRTVAESKGSSATRDIVESAVPQKWVDPNAVNVKGGSFDVVKRLADRYNLETEVVTTDGRVISTIEPTSNGPATGADDRWQSSVSADNNARLVRQANEGVIAYLRRVAAACESQRFPGAGAYDVYIRTIEEQPVLFFLTRRYALETGLSLERRKRFTIYHPTHAIDDPEQDTDVIDWEVNDQSLAQAVYGGQGVRSLGTDESTGAQRVEESSYADDELWVGSGLRSSAYQGRQSIVQISGGFDPNVAKVQAQARMQLFRSPLRATMQTVGYPEVQLHDAVYVRVVDDRGQDHWQTGWYIVIGYSHDVSADGTFETTLELARDGYGEGNSAEKAGGANSSLFSTLPGDLLQDAARVVRNTVRQALADVSLRQPVAEVGVPILEFTDTLDEPPPRGSTPREGELRLALRGQSNTDLRPSQPQLAGGETNSSVTVPVEEQ